ncbi:GGDEF domain-containing protein [Catenovulum sp. 2E275]|uniref:GGDEF domain-containing protein n=1 Tax=Catenovulum sp. 2E275 TaxID=2980497 RepID=UPI0021D0ED20|nr:GGDEF domain-containing protein [Catenovulum sp. 2E275]MCU4674625.1 GGDEF domain-containing protein [Catenovulum sp. 2E275]
MITSKVELLKSAVEITKNKDKPAIITALLDELEKLIAYDVMALLKVEDNNENQLEVIAVRLSESSDFNCLVTDLSKDALIQHCIDEKRIRIEQSVNMHKCVFPLILSGQIYAVLSIYIHSLSQEQITLIELLIKISANLLTTVHDSELDTLTGLLNRRTLEYNLADFFSDLKPRNDNLLNDQFHNWLVILDIDKFKSINDQYGHTYGDEVLLLFSNIMKQNFRSSDLLFRYGGEEFIVVISFASEEQVERILERFRKAVAQFNFPQVGKVTTCAGAALIDASLHPNTVIEQADKALYYCKENGRNQIALYHKLIEQNKIGLSQSVDTDIELF